MSANVLTYNAIGTILNQIVTQATGKAVITPTNTSEFVAVAQTGLLAGYDNLMGAISQVLSRTIISTRPYSRHFQGLEADAIRYGNHVRKINYVDRDWEDGSRLPLTTGVPVDDQSPTIDEVLQTNFYGQNDYEIPWTLFSNQIDVAFQNADELGAFITGKLQTISDQTEQKHESMARMILANLIAGLLSINNPHQVYHMVSDYNTYSGYSPVKTLTDIRGDAAEYAKFTKWMYGRVEQISAMLTERAVIYHQNVTGKEISRHTPYSKQNVYLLSSERFQMEASVLADVYHDNYLRMADNAILNFWQSITSPDTISITPTYMLSDGSLDTPLSPVNQTNVFGVICDVEAAGYTIVNQRTTSAAYNGKGEFQNFWLKFTDRYWNDFTENAAVLLLD
jgi:hypothetical protein